MRFLQPLQLHLETGELDGGATIFSGSQSFRCSETEFGEQVVVEREDPSRSSLMVVDYRDDRITSPQNWLVDEIMSNAASSINVLTERDQVMPPSSGYHCSFANYTLDGIKAVLVFAMSFRTRGLCAQWDPHASSALSHLAFQPFTWPVMFDTSDTYVDVKVFNGKRGPVPLGVPRLPFELRPVGAAAGPDQESE